jgi:hypothetical protein
MKNDISKIYKIGSYTISFYSKDWTWVAVNIFGFGIDSDLSLSKLKKRIKNLLQDEKQKA